MGTTDRNSVLGIYDLAGNVLEWTLEKTIYTNGSCAYRGGYCGGNGFDCPAFHRSGNSISASGSCVGFRVVLW